MKVRVGKSFPIGRQRVSTRKGGAFLVDCALLFGFEEPPIHRQPFRHRIQWHIEVLANSLGSFVEYLRDDRLAHLDAQTCPSSR